MLLPLGIGVLAVVGFIRRKRQQTGVLTQERLDQLVSACTYVQDPAALRKLATAYDEEKLKPQGDILRKRATLRELPKEAQEARAAVFAKAMASTKVDVMIKVAEAYESEGCFGAGAAIREAAKGAKAVQDAAKNAPLEKPVVVDKQAAA